MKKKLYIAPQMETVSLNTTSTFLMTSNLTPEDWTGGGTAGGRLLDDDDPLNILLGGEIPLGL